MINYPNSKMVKSCSVPGCNNIYKKGSKIRFLTFPTEDEMKDKWTKALERQGWKLTKDSAICSEHFPESDFVVPGQILRFNATPSIFSAPLSPQKLPTEKTIQSSSSENDSEEERLWIQSSLVEVKMEISEEKDVSEEETDSIERLYYPVLNAEEEEEEEEQPEYTVSKDSTLFTSHQTLHKQATTKVPTNNVSYVTIELDSTARKGTRTMGCYVQMGGDSLSKIKECRKKLRKLKKRLGRQEKLLKKMTEVSAIHEYKCLVEADYKLMLGELQQATTPVDTDEPREPKEHSYIQDSKQADPKPNSESQNETNHSES